MIVMRFSSTATLLVAAAVVFLRTPPAAASDLFFSGNGAGTACSQAAPCPLATAVSEALAGMELACADSSGSPSVTISKSITIDCVGTTGHIAGVTVDSGAVVTLANFTLGGGLNLVLQSGTAILENVHLTGVGTAISAQPNAPSTLIVKNSRIDSNSAGALLKPAAGGSLSARFDRVTIAANLGGGIKIDTTNGPVTVDVTDSEISSNAGNGLNAVGGAGGPAMFSINRSVIAKNGAAGVQASGANSAALISTSLLDSNTAGALSAVGGGRILTYGNNSIVGSSGTGFTGSASLQ
jgi:hypothetical protein